MTRPRTQNVEISLEDELLDIRPDRYRAGLARLHARVARSAMARGARDQARQQLTTARQWDAEWSDRR